VLKLKTAGLITVIIFVFNTFAAAAFTDTDKTEYERAALVLSALDIMSGYSDKTFRPDESLTRAEFATATVRVMGISSAVKKSGDVEFPDVGVKHWAYGVISMACSLGYFEGFGDGTFGPDNPVTLEQAVKVMVSMLRYGFISESSGSYPSGYLAVARQKNLLRGIGASTGRPISRGDAALLIYNSLEAEMLTQRGSAIYTEGATILSENLGVKTVKGIITANSLTELKGGTRAPDGQVTVNGENYDVNKTEAESYLGYDVMMYVTKDADPKTDVKKIIMIFPSKNNNLYMVSAEDIDDTTDNSNFNYWENGSRKTFGINKETTMIYNSKAHYLFDKEDIMHASGEVILLDNNRDGRLRYNPMHSIAKILLNPLIW